MGIRIFLIVCVAALLFLFYVLFQLVEDSKHQSLGHRELAREDNRSPGPNAVRLPGQKIVAFRDSPSPAQRQSS